MYVIPIPAPSFILTLLVQIYDTLDERNACIPPNEEMIKQAKRLIANDIGEEGANGLDIRGG